MLLKIAASLCSELTLKKYRLSRRNHFTTQNKLILVGQVCVNSWSSFHCAVNALNAPKYTRKKINGGHRSCSLSVSLKATCSPLNRRQYKIKVIIKKYLYFTYLNEAIFDLSNGRLKFDFVEYFKKPRVTNAGAYWNPKTKSPILFVFRLSPESSSIVVVNLLLLPLWCFFPLQLLFWDLTGFLTLFSSEEWLKIL